MEISENTKIKICEIIAETHFMLNPMTYDDVNIQLFVIYLSAH